MDLLKVALPPASGIISYQPYTNMDALFASQYYRDTKDYFGTNPASITFYAQSYGVMNGGEYCEQYLKKFCSYVVVTRVADGDPVCPHQPIFTITKGSEDSWYRAIAISDTIKGVLTTYCSLASGFSAPNFEDYERFGTEVSDHFHGVPVAFSPSWNFVDMLYLENAFRMGCKASKTPSAVYPVSGFNSIMLDKAPYRAIMLISDEDYADAGKVSELLSAEMFDDRISVPRNHRLIDLDLSDPKWRDSYEGDVDMVVVTCVHPTFKISIKFA